jgi:dolichyl-phosphate-mannose-protein mannosyltransferase
VKLPTKYKTILEAIDFPYLFLITWLSLLVHFWRITYPNSVIFDEVTFGKFLNCYAKGEYYFDLHPPLGKLLLAWAAYFGKINPNFTYEKIGTVFTDHAYIWIRSLTALAGSLIAPSVFLLLRGFRFSLWVAVVAATFVIFENSLLVISRTFVFDIFLLSFGFASLAAAVWAQRSQSRGLWFCSWVLGTAAFSIKWTGFSFLGILSLWELQRAFRDKAMGNSLRRLLVGWSVFFCFYLLVFAVHFAWTPRAGIGKDFMSAEFQSGLIGSPFYGRTDLERPGLLAQFGELNKLMWSYQQTMKQKHPYSSAWYSWPVMYRPIYFWGNTQGALKERIYLLGNPLLWWVSALAVLYFAARKWRLWRQWLTDSIDSPAGREFNLLILFSANYLPFVLIGRVMFIYHYLVALVVALMVLALNLESYRGRRWVPAFIVLVLMFFWFFAPLSYALPLSDREYQWRLWFSNWL